MHVSAFGPINANILIKFPPHCHYSCNIVSCWQHDSRSFKGNYNVTTKNRKKEYFLSHAPHYSSFNYKWAQSTWMGQSVRKTNTYSTSKSSVRLQECLFPRCCSDTRTSGQYGSYSYVCEWWGTMETHPLADVWDNNNLCYNPSQETKGNQLENINIDHPAIQLP